MYENISIGTFGLVHNKQMFIISGFIISDPDCSSNLNYHQIALEKVEQFPILAFRTISYFGSNYFLFWFEPFPILQIRTISYFCKFELFPAFANSNYFPFLQKSNYFLFLQFELFPVFAKVELFPVFAKVELFPVFAKVELFPVFGIRTISILSIL